MAKENILSAVLFFEKQGMKEKADSLRDCIKYLELNMDAPK